MQCYVMNMLMKTTDNEERERKENNKPSPRKIWNTQRNDEKKDGAVEAVLGEATASRTSRDKRKINDDILLDIKIHEKKSKAK